MQKYLYEIQVDHAAIISELLDEGGELWQPIKGYENNYEISSKGRVRSLITNKVIKENVNVYGYCFLSLSKNNRVKCARIHRLVAEAFIPNPENLPYVNHINCNKTDNNVENLEWCTHQDNMDHAKANKRFVVTKPWLGSKSRDMPMAKPIQQFDLNGNLIAEYGALKEAADALRVNFKTISKAALGERNTAFGFIWKYKN